MTGIHLFPRALPTKIDFVKMLLLCVPRNADKCCAFPVTVTIVTLAIMYFVTIHASDSQDAPFIAEFVRWAETKLLQGDSLSDNAVEPGGEMDSRPQLAVKVSASKMIAALQSNAKRSLASFKKLTV